MTFPFLNETLPSLECGGRAERRHRFGTMAAARQPSALSKPKRRRRFALPAHSIWALLLASVLVTAVSLFLTGCGREQGAAAAGETAKDSKTLYTCGMHPQVVQDHPGNCPICGMKLTPIRKQNEGSGAAPASGERKIKYYKSTMMPGETSPTPRKDSMGMDMVPVYEEQAAAAHSEVIAIDPVTIQNMGVRTAVLTRGPLRRSIRTVGTIQYNETALADVTTKFKGWVEKLEVDATGQQVHRGDTLFEIYSPELYSAQQEYLLATGAGANGSDQDSLKTSARTKLKFFDISDEQIAELERTKQPSKTLRIQAPIDGFVVEKMVVQGQMVDPGMKLYRLADLSLVWVQAQIYEQDLSYIKLGQEATVTLSYLPDREFRGRVTYIYPNVDEKTRTAQVRMEFHNPGFFLKPGMFATVQVDAELAASALLVPDMAILRSGEKNTVFVALPGGKFEPRNVSLGPQAENDMFQVISGLKEGERVVTSGQFMLDSESQLREAIQKMQPVGGERGSGERGAGERGSGGASGTGATLNAPDAQRSTAVSYICPMPEHISIKYDHPGKCPICGMTLVPVTEAALEKLQPGGQVQYYTCPMPEHSDVHSPKPGKCPKCGMTLVPVMAPPPLPRNVERGSGGSGGSVERGERGASATRSTLNAPDAQRSTLYTCPMASHAHVVSDKPGKCPECEMDLVPTSSVAHGKLAEESWRKQHAQRP